MAAIAYPVFVNKGTFANGAAAVTPGAPANSVENDIWLLFVESEGAAISPPSVAWTEVVNSPQATGATAGAIYWLRYDGVTAPSRVVPDTGDHTSAIIIAYRGCRLTGTPYCVSAGGVDAVSDQSGSIPGTTTTVPNCMIVAFCTSTNDADSTTEFTWANANLANLTERHDQTSKTAAGGGFGIVEGQYAGPGNYGSTTATLVNNSVKAMISLALMPEVGYTQRRKYIISKRRQTS